MLEIPAPIVEYLHDLVRLRWSGKDPQPVLDSLPTTMAPGAVQILVSGGPFGWMMEARLDEIDGRVALEVLEDDRMSGPGHYRVWGDGTRESLPNEHTGYSTPADCPPEEIERIEQKFYAHNREVQELLAERGFRRFGG